jgi:hypothetical protein
MADNGIADFFVHSASVELFLGTSGYGVDSFSPPTVVAGFADDARKVVRDSEGQEVVSESTFYTLPANASLFGPDSRVTINGNISRVIKMRLNTSGGLGLPDHCVVTLT